MSRAQCIVLRGNRILMVDDGSDRGWSLPGGRIEEGESPAEAAIRELKEECCVDGTIVCETGVAYFPVHGNTYYTDSFLVEIGHQAPRLNSDWQELEQIKWMTISEIPEKNRVFLWAAGLLGIEQFWTEVLSWDDRISYPGSS